MIKAGYNYHAAGRITEDILLAKSGVTRIEWIKSIEKFEAYKKEGKDLKKFPSIWEKVK